MNIKHQHCHVTAICVTHLESHGHTPIRLFVHTDTNRVSVPSVYMAGLAEWLAECATSVLYSQVYKRMAKFERAARYDRMWRLCPSHVQRPPLSGEAPSFKELACCASRNTSDFFYFNFWWLLDVSKPIVS